MIPMSWPEFNLHPYVPKTQAKGYLHMIEELGGWLKDITKFDGISFQANSGATG
jgi:glycine dehydrogenase